MEVTQLVPEHPAKVPDIFPPQPGVLCLPVAHHQKSLHQAIQGQEARSSPCPQEDLSTHQRKPPCIPFLGPWPSWGKQSTLASERPKQGGR